MTPRNLGGERKHTFNNSRFIFTLLEAYFILFMLSHYSFIHSVFSAPAFLPPWATA
jgi:hypothetical protein